MVRQVTKLPPVRTGEAAAAGDPAPTRIAPELRIVEWQNQWVVRSAFPFAYQGPDEMLSQLRERYRLDEVVAPGRTEFEQMLLLREWVHTRWKHGWSERVPGRNALDILDAAAQGEDFYCGYYAITLMQCLLALGFVARILGLSKAATEWRIVGPANISHAVIEVWSHQFHKWVLLDPDMNVHYERRGIPLHGLEIHRAWVTRCWDEVLTVQGPTPLRITDKAECGLGTVYGNLDNVEAEFWTFSRHNAGDYYAHFGLPTLRNTQHSSDERTPTVEWIDEWTPPKVVAGNAPSVALWTSNAHDLYWTVDQVQINLRAQCQAWQAGEATLQVSLDHSMPNLDRLLVRLDEEHWRETAPEFTWHLRPGKNQVMAKGVNAFGREGHTSRVLLRYHP